MHRNRQKNKARMPTGKLNANIKNTGYSNGGASRTSDILKKWMPLRASAKADINANLNILRNRAADQATNTPIGAAAINNSSVHVIGAGLTLFPRVKYKLLGMDALEAREWNRKTAAEFDLWAASKDCDIFKRNNFYDLQSILYTSYLTDGDSFSIFRRGIPNNFMPYSLRLQALEGNRVSNPLGNTDCRTIDTSAVEMIAPNGNHIVSGVEIDSNGATVAYWVSNKVPFDPVDIGKTPNWIRIEAFGESTGQANILQISHDERPEQYRGVPYLAPVIETLKQVSRYTTAELTAAIIRSFFALFFTSQTSSPGISDVLPSPNEEGAADDGRAPVVDASEYGLSVGSMNALPKGVDVKSIDASSSVSVFEPFITQLINQIGAAIGQPPEVLMKHFSNSYSASRAALLQAWEEFRLRRAWFSRDFCQPVYETWLTEAIAIGRIEAPGFFDDPLMHKAYCNAEWYGPTMSILDPVKDVTGSALRKTYGLSTGEREAAEMTGTDFEENLEQLQLEKQLIDKYGLDAGNPEVLAGAIVAAEQNQDNKNGGDNDEEVLENKK